MGLKRYLVPGPMLGALVLAASTISTALTAQQCANGTPPPCRDQAVRAPAANSVAVLYFDNMSRDTADAYLADGLTEEIILRLGQVPRLAVKSRFEALRVRGRAAGDPRVLGRTLNAAYLLSGNVQRSGARVRVRVELVRATTGARIWGEGFDRTSNDVLAIEEEIARAVVQGVTGQILPEERTRIGLRPTADPVAYDLYLRGNYLANRFTEPELRAAIALYQQAFARDSTFAQAQIGIANAWFFLADDWVAPLDAYRQGRTAARRALAIDSTVPAAAYLILPALTLDYDVTGAEAAAERALAREPGSAWAQFSMMFVREAQGRRADAAALALRGWERDTVSFLGALVTAVNLSLMGAMDELARFLPRTRAAIPEQTSRGWDGVVQFSRGQCREAVAPLRSEEQAFLRAFLVSALVCAGQRAEAREALDALVRKRQTGYQSAGVVAVAWAALGDLDSAFVWLDRAADERDTVLMFLRLWPLAAPLRADPRFDALMRRTWLRPRS